MDSTHRAPHSIFLSYATAYIHISYSTLTGLHTLERWRAVECDNPPPPPRRGRRSLHAHGSDHPPPLAHLVVLIKSVISMCVSNVRVQNVTWPRDQFLHVWYQKMPKTWRKKTHEKVCRDLRLSRGNHRFCTGGSNWLIPPPPPPPRWIRVNSLETTHCRLKSV